MEGEQLGFDLYLAAPRKADGSTGFAPGNPQLNHWPGRYENPTLSK